jgi:hypothetical protein
VSDEEGPGGAGDDVQQDPPGQDEPAPAAAEPDAADPSGPEQPPTEPSADSIVTKRKSGGSRSRLGSQQEALHNFSGAANLGQAAGRDFTINNYPTDARPAAEPFTITADHIEEIRETFVDPPEWESLVRACAGRRVVFLMGKSGSGRYAAARRLLADRTPLLGIDEKTTLDGLTKLTVTAQAGYIWPDMRREEIKALTRFQIEALTARMDKADARLVVTVPTTAVFGDEEALAEHVFRLERVPDPSEIVRRILEWRLRDNPDQVERIMNAEGVSKLFEEELADKGAPPARAKEIALQLLDAYEKDLPLAKTVRVLLDQRDDERIPQWFGGLGKRSVQCTAIALAVLNGEPHEVVSRAGDRLWRYMRPPGEVQTHKDEWETVLEDESQVLESLGAVLDESRARTWHHAEAPTEVVRYLNPNIQATILQYAYRAFSKQRMALLNWLKTTAATGSETVRDKVAVATGLLAVRSYDQVRIPVILPWAGSADHRLRATAAFALKVAASTDEAREAVRNTVEGWTEEPGDRLRATAARAWQVAYDAGGAEAALQGLDKLGDDDSLLVIDAVCDSLTELWEVEGDRLEAAEMLLEWLGTKNIQRQQTARLAFLVASVELIHEVESADGPVVWPKLLHIATADPGKAEQIARLWRDVITGPIGNVGKQTLTAWVEAAEPDLAMRRALTRLLLMVAEADRTKVRLARLTNRWKKDHPNFAREFGAALQRKAVP